MTWVVEIKVLLVLCYYVILGTAVLTIFTIDLTDIYTHKSVLLQYFACEGKGLLPSSNVSRCAMLEKSIHTSFNPIPTSVAIVILGFLPAVNLVYVVKLSDLKTKLKTYSQIRQIQYVQKEASGASRYVPYNVNNEHMSTALQQCSLTSGGG